MERTVRAAIYCRLSEEDSFKSSVSDDSNSIINQKALLSQYCADNGWEIADIYSDDDFTGSDRARPEFCRLLGDAERRKFNVVLCKTQSRFTRELEIVEKYINHLFPIWGIRFVSIVDNADTAVKGNKKSRQINGLINEWYLEDMSENIRAVLTSRRKNGFFIGAFAPFGYKKDPERKGHLVIDEEAAETVRHIFALYLSGIGRTAVARTLNAEGVPTMSEYKLLHGERYMQSRTAERKPMWRYCSVAGILTNEVYIGHLVQNKAHSVSYKSKIVRPTEKTEWIRVENTHEPIIDSETWSRAQRLLASREKPTFTLSGIPNIFARKLVCGECGGIARTGIGSGKNKKRYYRCSVRYCAPSVCRGFNIPFAVLRDSVLTELKRLTGEYADAGEIISKLAAHSDTGERIEARETELKRICGKIRKNELCIKNLYLDKLGEAVDGETYNELYSSLTRDRQSNEAAKERCEAELTRLREGNEHEATAAARKYLDCDELTYEAVRLFIDRIVIYPNKRYSRRYEIEIYWSF